MALSSRAGGGSGSRRPLGGGGLNRPLSDINVTPLVDVMLVLLIVFMVTAPMLATGLKVDLPQTQTAQPINPKDPIVISVESDGSLAVGTQRMRLADLIAVLQTMLQGDTSRIIQIRADRSASYGDVVGVIDQLASNGMVHIALISNPGGPDTDTARPTPAGDTGPAR